MLKVALGIAAFVLAAQAAYTFGMPHVETKLVSQKMEELTLQHKLKNDAELKRDILSYMRDKQLAVTEKNVRVQRFPNKVTIAAHYERPVDYLFIHKKWTFYPASEPGASLQAERERLRARFAD